MNTQIMTVGSTKSSDPQRRRPRIRLAGFWLCGIGFEPDTLVTADYTDGCITLKSQGTGMDTYRRIIRQVRKKNSGLLQVRNGLNNKKHTPHLEVKGFWLEPLGFSIGSVILVQSEPECIRIRRIDVESLLSRQQEGFLSS